METKKTILTMIAVAGAIFAGAAAASGQQQGEDGALAAPKPKGGMRAKTGGSIMRPLPEGSKAIVFIDARGGGGDATAQNPDGAGESGRGGDVLEAFVKRFKSMTRLYVKTEKGDAADIESSRHQEGDVVIALVDEGDLAVMPAKRMATVPVGADDAATARDLWKATVAVFSLMGDAPNDFNGSALIRGAAESIGIPFVEMVFYKKALEEGWAPEPKDEYQKRLWEEFHGAHE